MRVLLSSWGSRGDVEPLAGLALRLRELGAEVRVCAPPDEEFVELFARVGVRLIPLGPLDALDRGRAEGAIPGRRPSARGRAYRRPVRDASSGGRGLRRAGRDRPDAGRSAGCRRVGRYPLRARVLPHLRAAVAPLPAGRAAGQAVARGRDRQPGALDAGRGARQRLVRRAPQPGTARRSACPQSTTSATTS